MKAITDYQCEICDKRFPSVIQAESCEARGRDEARFQMGDIVFGSAAFGWFDGDEAWVSNPGVRFNGAQSPLKPCPKKQGNCFDACCCFRFYYVVTRVDADDRDPHRTRYHIATDAMTGMKGYRGGCTYNRYHVPLKRVDNPPAYVVEASKALLGMKFDHII